MSEETKPEAACEDCFCSKMYRKAHDPANRGLYWACLRLIFRRKPGDGRCCCKKASA